MRNSMIRYIMPQLVQIYLFFSKLSLLEGKKTLINLHCQQLLSDHESDEDREALEMLWDETDDEVEEEFLDIPENDDDAESDFGPSGFSIDDDDQEDQRN